MHAYLIIIFFPRHEVLAGKRDKAKQAFCL